MIKEKGLITERAETIFKACYSYKKEVMENFFKNDILALVWKTAYPYLQKIPYQANANR